MSHRERKKCELIRCLSGHRLATIDCLDTNGDFAYLVGICEQCGDALKMRQGDDLPSTAEINRLFTEAKRKRRASKKQPA